jgi:hypothetical protein
MNRIYLMSMVLAIFSFNHKQTEEDCLPEHIELKAPSKPIKQVDTRLVEALIQVESRGNDSCIGDRHLIIPSIGCLQIRPIMVREVNRILNILGENKQYNNKDRYSRIKSIEMFNIWRGFHHKDHDNEIIARCWNGGPKGWKHKATLHYWYKVQKALQDSVEV